MNNVKRRMGTMIPASVPGESFWREARLTGVAVVVGVLDEDVDAEDVEDAEEEDVDDEVLEEEAIVDEDVGD